MNFNRITIGLSALALIAFGEKVLAAGETASPGTTRIVKIGLVGPLSGGLAHLGKDDELGARMAIDDLNAKGLQIGGAKVKFELASEDDAADPKQGTAVAQMLVDMKVNGVVGHLNSGTTIPASRIYNDAGIPEISPSATNPRYTRQGYKTAFRLVADDTQLGGTMGRYAVQTLKAKTIAVIDDRSAYGQGVAEEFEKAAKAAGATIVGHEFTTDKSTAFDTILTKLKATKPDVVFFGGQDAVGGPMLRQMKGLAFNAKFMGGDGICTTEMSQLAGDAIGEGNVYCAEAGGVEGEFKGSLDAWKTKFKAKNGIEVQLYAAYVYDAVNVLVAAMQKANSAEPAKYLPEVGKVQMKGLTGPIAFDDKGDVKNGALTLFTFRGGKKEQIAVVR